MAKVKLVAPDQFITSDIAPPGERTWDVVQTQLGISGSFPLHAGFRILSAGAGIEWCEVASGVAVHVWDGAAEIEGVALEKGSAVIIEHGASARIDALRDDTRLLVFDAASNHPPDDAAGGSVHVLPAERVQRTDCLGPNMQVGAAIYADASCKTCRLWLHENSYMEPYYEVGLHSHSQDEIIVVIAGEMTVGARTYARGSMLAVAKDVLYRFKAGSAGLQYINFRPSRPTYTAGDGSLTMDERSIYRDVFRAPPPYL